MQTVTLTLPRQPLPLHACFVNVARFGRADSPAYKTWKQEADAHLVKFHAYGLGYPKHAKIPGHVKVHVVVRKPDRRKRDLDNLCKAALDTLVRNYVIEDDSAIVDLRISWGEADTPHATAIVIESAIVPLLGLKARAAA